MDHSIPNWLIKRANLTPDRPALYFEADYYTFGDLYLKANQWARKLTALGVNKGNLVAILLKNEPDTIFIIHALQLIGAQTLFINNRLSLKEICWQVQDADAKYFISDLDFKQKLVDLESIQGLTLCYMEEMVEEYEFVQQEEFHLQETCSIMYTSGTTGFPKGVMQSYGNHWWSAVGSALNLGLHEKDCWLCTVPLFHISGFSILMRSIIYGIPVDLHVGFNEENVNKSILSGRVTIVSVVSSMLTRLLENLNKKTYPNSFRCMLLGGGPAPLSLLQQCKGKNIPVFQTYGMTETSSQIVTLAPEYSLSKLGSAGKPLFPAQLKIVVKDRNALPNEQGEIVVKGPNVTSGYLNNGEATKQAIKDGWLHTGDMGFLDEEGFLFVLDRRSDLIISGGENIYPAEIENVLLSHIDVLEAGVTGVAHKKWGQVPVAFIVKKQGVSLTKEELLHYCKQHLAKYKIPKDVVFIEQLPRNAANKLVRRQLLHFIPLQRAVEPSLQDFEE